MPAERLEIAPMNRPITVAAAMPMIAPTQGLSATVAPPSASTRFAIVKPAMP